MQCQDHASMTKQTGTTANLGLFGINSCNRVPENFWGKNVFNNLFPMSLACWMRAEGIPFVLITSKNGTTQRLEAPIDNLFGLAPDESPHFDFETALKANSDLCHSRAERVDVVIRPTKPEVARSRGLEIKLVVVPDSSTMQSAPDQWAPEIVVRPSTTTNCAIQLYRHLKSLGLLDQARVLLEPRCSQVHAWDNPIEMKSLATDILPALYKIIKMCEQSQLPLMTCAIWKTEGKSPVLCEQAFDIFAWTDCAFMQMVADKSQSATRSARTISRPTRAALRTVRMLFDLFVTQKVNLENILSQMSYRSQDDKDFSISGAQTINYMKHHRLISPAVPRSALNKIILGDGIEQLSPERRLDATLYFTFKYTNAHTR